MQLAHQHMRNPVAEQFFERTQTQRNIQYSEALRWMAHWRPTKADLEADADGSFRNRGWNTRGKGALADGQPPVTEVKHAFEHAIEKDA